ncbi:pilus assembly PilX family protein [Marinobacter bohaiensis]|uniref:pilus assembly PilX family protein n=1 Tax=Marinobacter bohaiensis TaxID=2201898 RepID=UPI000DACCC07|nr:PilX N-terminal domain-containing pilus assembly protein [Marinobacter bohaiensis]
MTRRPLTPPSQQNGAALLIALILLAVILIIGLAGAQMTKNEEQMSGNFYDRDLAFQAAESALRAGQAVVEDFDYDGAGDSGSVYDCEDNFCEAIPANELGDADDGRASDSPGWVSVDDSDAVSDLALTPQYVIDRVATVADDTSSESASRNATSNQYGSSTSDSSTAYVYRITARSADPDSDETEGRAYVVLQAYVKRTL